MDGNEIDLSLLKFNEVYEETVKFGMRHNIKRVHGGYLYILIVRTRDGKDHYRGQTFVPLVLNAVVTNEY